MKSITESIIGKRGDRENPCYQYKDMFGGGLDGFFEYLENLVSIKKPAYDAFFWNTGVAQDYKTDMMIIHTLRDWMYEYLDELEEQALEMGIPRSNARAVAIEWFMDGVEDDNEFFERCKNLKKYLKSERLRYNLLCNFRIYLHLS